MDRVPVFYATTEGHTRRVAETIASVLREEGFESEAIDMAASPDRLEWEQIRGVVVGASLHGGTHQRTAQAFVTREAPYLKSKPAAFFSVSLSAASRSAGTRAAAQAIATGFAQKAGWSPQRVICVAGKLAYTQYGFVKRWIMRRIARAEGQPTDTSRDYEYTDWPSVREFALAFARDIRTASARASGTSGSASIGKIPA